MGGGRDKLAWTACSQPLQLSIQTNATKKTAEFDVNYVYYLYIFTFRYFKISIQTNATKKTAEFDLNYVYYSYIFTFRYFKISRISEIILLRYQGGWGQG